MIGKLGMFELLGFDVMMDDSGKPFLLEININPALFTDTTTQAQLLPRLVEDTVKVVLGIHEDDPSYIDDTGYKVLYTEE